MINSQNFYLTHKLVKELTRYYNQFKGLSEDQYTLRERQPGVINEFPKRCKIFKIYRAIQYNVEITFSNG